MKTKDCQFDMSVTATSGEENRLNPFSTNKNTFRYRFISDIVDMHGNKGVKRDLDPLSSSSVCECVTTESDIISWRMSSHDRDNYNKQKDCSAMSQCSNRVVARAMDIDSTKCVYNSVTHQATVLACFITASMSYYFKHLLPL